VRRVEEGSEGVSEHPLQKAALEALNRLPGVRAYRNNTGAIKKGGRWIAYGLRAFHGETGGADLIVCVAGMFVAIELKDTDGVPSKEQYAWGEALERAGGIWIWSTNLQEIVNRVLEIQRTKRAA
jgi:hypothetical protein